MINYPNGKPARQKAPITPSKQPARKSNLGKALEDDLNQTNAYYRAHGLALVYKKPTPITIVKVDYPQRNKAKIVEAYYQLPSTTDYNGIVRGLSIDFEAKQTINKTRLPLSMIHDHQLRHLKAVLDHGGFSFLIIRFNSHGTTHFVAYQDLLPFLDTKPKSIPYQWICDHGLAIESSYLAPCDYLTALNSYLKKGTL